MNKLSTWKMTLLLCVCCAATAIALPAQTFKSLFSFDGTDGEGPSAVVQGTDGNFYGTTYSGGAYTGCIEGASCGTVFKISPTGTLTTLHNFDSTDGGYPGALVQATDGNFYGTTSYGGANLYYGTVFKITPTGALTTLYSFCSHSNCTDGDLPNGLVQATDGNFYRTTSYGGANLSCNAGQGCGTVFKITPNGTLNTLYNFCSLSGCTDGLSPNALIEGIDGNFYGTTPSGGANTNGACELNGQSSCGTIFKLTPGGTLTTLYSFCAQRGCTDGAAPIGVVQAPNGSFYGITYLGGNNCGDVGTCGTVFKISPGGTLTTLYAFCSIGDCADGSFPVGLVQASGGNFYGTTYYGGDTNYCSPGSGTSGCGTVFKIGPTGTLTTLYSFCSQTNCTDGTSPDRLVQGTNGEFYGTTAGGGAYGFDGTVFSLSVGLGPFVETEPTSGKVGSVIKILGTDLTGAINVTFNGTPAVFKVLSSSLIGATVPEGATTGPVAVTTPSGTLTSNVNFRVQP